MVIILCGCCVSLTKSYYTIPNNNIVARTSVIIMFCKSKVSKDLCIKKYYFKPTHISL